MHLDLHRTHKTHTIFAHGWYFLVDLFNDIQFYTRLKVYVGVIYVRLAYFCNQPTSYLTDKITGNAVNILYNVSHICLCV